MFFSRYFHYLDWMEAEMLLMYSYIDSTDIMTLIVRLTVIIAVILTIPLTHFPVSKHNKMLFVTSVHVNLYFTDWSYTML